MILTPGSQLRCLKPFGLFNSGRESLIAVSTLVPIKADRRLVACFDRVEPCARAVIVTINHRNSSN